MRRKLLALGLLASVWPMSGCLPDASTPEDLVESVLGVTTAPGDVAPTASSTASAPATAAGPSVVDNQPQPAAAPDVQTVSGNLRGEGSYQIFELGAGSAGDQWTIRPNGLLGSPFVVGLFDRQFNLVRRLYMGNGSRLTHTLRAATDQLKLGVMVPVGQAGGRFRFEAELSSRNAVPAPRPQTVWLNFSSASDLKVHTRSPVTFAAFDAAMIGDAYAGHTDTIKRTIVAEMQADYAAYNITIISSDDAPAPSGPHSVVHFGGDVSGLLGLADSVDAYNADDSQNAIVYIDSFAAYWTMRLTPEEMGLMIANVASHELGHLLGLYHTKDPEDVMDTTGTAWELAANQSFGRALLEPSVFVTGYEDSPVLLRRTLGPAGTSTAKQLAAARIVLPTGALIRRLAQKEVTYACGTCAELYYGEEE